MFCKYSPLCGLQMAMTEATLVEVEAVTAVYAPLAMSCSAIYSVLEQLAQVSLTDGLQTTLGSTQN